MRSAPGGGTDSVVYPGVLNEPTLLFVVEGPTAASDYEWYLVYPFAFETERSQRPEQWRLAWVAAGSRDGEPWIAPASLDCPQPNLGRLMELSSMAGLACFGDGPLTLEGSYGGCSPIVPGVITPAWLGSFACFLRPLGTSPDASLAQPSLLFQVQSDPAAAIPGLIHEIGTDVRITGHFDDPDALTCVAGPLPAPSGFEPTPAPPGDETLAAQAVVLACRAHFVVTESAPLSP